MIQPVNLTKPDSVAWFCVRTLPKHEHIAAAQLRTDEQVEVFLPRIRFQRNTRRGPSWVTEALFVNYFFARFELASRLRLVQAARGVRSVVHFGDKWPAIPDGVIADLRTLFGDEEIKTLSHDIRPGDSVEIADGALFGLQAVVMRVMPGKQRVAVLLDFLGRQTAVEVATSQLRMGREIRAASEISSK